VRWGCDYSRNSARATFPAAGVYVYGLNSKTCGFVRCLQAICKYVPRGYEHPPGHGTDQDSKHSSEQRIGAQTIRSVFPIPAAGGLNEGDCFTAHWKVCGFVAPAA
jgi:hypothetical protein